MEQKNEIAAALARMGKGVPRRFSADQLTAATDRLAEAREKLARLRARRKAKAVARSQDANAKRKGHTKKESTNGVG